MYILESSDLEKYKAYIIYTRANQLLKIVLFYLYTIFF